MSEVGQADIQIECPNCIHKGPKWQVFTCTIKIMKSETTYGGKCPACGFYIWDKWSLKAFMQHHERPAGDNEVTRGNKL